MGLWCGMFTAILVLSMQAGILAGICLPPGVPTTVDQSTIDFNSTLAANLTFSANPIYPGVGLLWVQPSPPQPITVRLIAPGGSGGWSANLQTSRIWVRLKVFANSDVGANRLINFNFYKPFPTLVFSVPVTGTIAGTEVTHEYVGNLPLTTNPLEMRTSPANGANNVIRMEMQYFGYQLP